MHLVTPRCVVSRPDTARAARRPCIVSWLRSCRRLLPQGAGRPGPAGSAVLGHIRMSGAVSDGWNTSGYVTTRLVQRLASVGNNMVHMLGL